MYQHALGVLPASCSFLKFAQYLVEKRKYLYKIVTVMLKYHGYLVTQLTNTFKEQPIDFIS